MASSPPIPTPNEVYAAYGMALYLAQSMEVGMRVFYWLDKALPTTPPGKAPRVDFNEEPLPDANINSLGGFIRHFRKELMEEGTVDVQTRAIMRKLEYAVEQRNWLVHSFWAERSSNFASPEGRQGMLSELHELLVSFRYHDRLIRHMVQLILANYDLQAEQISAESFQSYLRLEQLFEAADPPG
jgi:hypothetical protein